MNRWKMGVLMALVALPLSGQSWMVNVAPDRPTFNLSTPQGTLSRTLAPGSRLHLEPGTLSVAGSRPLVLEAGKTYYWARWNGPVRLYQVESTQALVINATGSALDVRLEGAQVAEGLLANGNFGLAERADNGLIRLEWSDDKGGSWTATLEGGRLYRLELGSPEGVGIQPVLTSWDDDASSSN